MNSEPSSYMDLLLRFIEVGGMRWLLLLLLTLLVAVLTHAYATGRKIKIGAMEIEGRAPREKSRGDSSSEGSPPSESHASTLGQVSEMGSRVALLCSTTREIEASQEKTAALKRFYRTMFLEIERTSYGINTCGAEPLRGELFQQYCARLATTPKSQLGVLNRRVRWYWTAGDLVGFNFEPAFFESRQARDLTERMIIEVTDSQVVVAFAGRTGTREQVERLISYHRHGLHGIDLSATPLVLLAWFGGTIKELIEENRMQLKSLLNPYLDLKPAEERPDWYQSDNPEQLARSLVHTIRRLIEEGAVAQPQFGLRAQKSGQPRGLKRTPGGAA